VSTRSPWTCRNDVRVGTDQYFVVVTTQLWIKGTRCLVRADAVVAITLERQEDPVMHLVRLEATDSQFLFGGWDNNDFDEVWPTVDEWSRCWRGAISATSPA
jgi:hypothetical protein